MVLYYDQTEHIGYPTEFSGSFYQLNIISKEDKITGKGYNWKLYCYILKSNLINSVIRLNYYDVSIYPRVSGVYLTLAIFIITEIWID